MSPCWWFQVFPTGQVGGSNNQNKQSTTKTTYKMAKTQTTSFAFHRSPSVFLVKQAQTCEKKKLEKSTVTINRLSTQHTSFLAPSLFLFAFSKAPNSDRAPAAARRTWHCFWQRPPGKEREPGAGVELSFFSEGLIDQFLKVHLEASRFPQSPKT